MWPSGLGSLVTDEDVVRGDLVSPCGEVSGEVSGEEVARGEREDLLIASCGEVRFRGHLATLGEAGDLVVVGEAGPEVLLLICIISLSILLMISIHMFSRSI